MSKKLIKVFLSLAVVFGFSILFSTNTVYAGTSSTNASEVSVGGFIMGASTGTTYMLNDGTAGSASNYNFYFDGNGTLTLKNANIVVDYDYEMGILHNLYAEGDLKINLIGTNTIKSNNFGEISHVIKFM